MKAISDEELERRFDAGEDIIQYADLSAVRRPNQERESRSVHIGIDMPEPIIRGIDRAAARIGIDRQALIKVWLAERLEQEIGIDTHMAGVSA